MSNDNPTPEPKLRHVALLICKAFGGDGSNTKISIHRDHDAAARALVVWINDLWPQVQGDWELGPKPAVPAEMYTAFRDAMADHDGFYFRIYENVPLDLSMVE